MNLLKNSALIGAISVAALAFTGCASSSENADSQAATTQPEASASADTAQPQVEQQPSQAVTTPLADTNSSAPASADSSTVQ